MPQPYSVDDLRAAVLVLDIDEGRIRFGRSLNRHPYEDICEFLLCSIPVFIPHPSLRVSS